MACFSTSRGLTRRLLVLRSLSLSSTSPLQSSTCSSHCQIFEASDNSPRFPAVSSRVFCSRPFNIHEAEGPASIDYSSLLQEDEFHRLADNTILDLQEKFEEYGDSVQVDGFDIDYGNQVLTLKLGNLGTYVLNKQVPNRQIWLSSPVSGPLRFDWDRSSEVWVYRRTKVNLLELLEKELEQLCGEPITLS